MRQWCTVVSQQSIGGRLIGTCEVFWVGNRVRQLLVALNLRWHRCNHHAIRKLLLDAAGKVLLPDVRREKKKTLREAKVLMKEQRHLSHSEWTRVLCWPFTDVCAGTGSTGRQGTGLIVRGKTSFSERADD